MLAEVFPAGLCHPGAITYIASFTYPIGQQAQQSIPPPPPPPPPTSGKACSAQTLCHACSSLQSSDPVLHCVLATAMAMHVHAAGLLLSCPRLGRCGNSTFVRTRVDCDGDGLLDWSCEDPRANLTSVITSSNECILMSPAPRNSCPASFGKADEAAQEVPWRTHRLPEIAPVLVRCRCKCECLQPALLVVQQGWSTAHPCGL